MTVIFQLDKHMIFRTYRSIAKSHELLCEITHFYWVPFGKHTKNYGNSTCLMCKSTISMAIFTSKLFVYQKVAHGNSPFLLVKSLLLMTGDVPGGDGSANARRLAFNVPSASVQNKSLEEARMLLGDVEVIFFLISISQYISYSYGSDVHQPSILGAPCWLSTTVMAIYHL